MSTEQLIESLKRVLKSRHITYAELARRIGMSEASVKRLFSQRTFTLNRLEQVLAALELDFFELAKLARGAGDAPEEMTEPQENALALEPRLMGVFYLLFNDWQPAQILTRYELTEAELTKLLVKLDRLHLIELLPANKVKLKSGGTCGCGRAGRFAQNMASARWPSFSRSNSIVTAAIFVSSFAMFRRRHSRWSIASSTGWPLSSTSWRSSTALCRRISGSRLGSCSVCGRGRSGRLRT